MIRQSRISGASPVRRSMNPGEHGGDSKQPSPSLPYVVDGLSMADEKESHPGPVSMAFMSCQNARIQRASGGL